MTPRLTPWLLLLAQADRLSAGPATPAGRMARARLAAAVVATLAILGRCMGQEATGQTDDSEFPNRLSTPQPRPHGAAGAKVPGAAGRQTAACPTPRAFPQLL